MTNILGRTISVSRVQFCSTSYSRMHEQTRVAKDLFRWDNKIPATVRYVGFPVLIRTNLLFTRNGPLFLSLWFQQGRFDHQWRQNALVDQ
jgi:hypothetical protein